jgi:putative endonuclease
MAQHNISGSKAEDMACEYLKVQGYKILQRNYKDRFCEIDIIACNKATLAFVEVKYRRRADFGGAVGAITADKFRRMHLSAEYWLSQNQQYSKLQPQLDVITVVGDIESPKIELLENVEY